MKSLKQLSVIVVPTLCLAALLLQPQLVHARKPGVLEGKPVVERKLELRKLRFQVSPTIGMSLAQPFIHTGFAGAKLQFDFTDIVGLRASFDFAPLTFQTDLTENTLKTLPLGAEEPGSTTSSENGGPYRPNDQRRNWAPLRHDFKAGLTRLQWQTSADLVFTPFAGKLGLFSSIFTEYDMYVFGGFGVTQWVNAFTGADAESTAEILGLTQATDSEALAPETCLQLDTNTVNNDCILHPVKADTGVRMGGSFGGGFHIFVSDWFSLNPEFQDIIIRHNDTGMNATQTDIFPVVNNDSGRNNDRALRHNVTFRLGFTFYLPPKAKRRTLRP